MRCSDCARPISIVILCTIGLYGNWARADFTFGKPMNMGAVVNSASKEGSPSISADGLEMYFRTNRPDGFGEDDIWVTTRATKEEPWGEPTALAPPVNTSSWSSSPCLSGDGLSLYFTALETGKGDDIWVTRRLSRDGIWMAPVNMGSPVNTSANESFVTVSADDLHMVLGDYDGRLRPGGHGGRDLWITTRPTITDAWATPQNMGPIVNSPDREDAPSLSADGLMLIFSSDRPGGDSSPDLWITRRTTTNDPWTAPINLGPPIHTPDYDQSASLSADYATLYFSSIPLGYGGFDLWQAPILPQVDFTGDYRVDIADLVLFIEHWGQNDPLFDIAPMPHGEGVVDAADLDVLMSYWGQEVYDPYFLAHWKFDESEGDIASDSATDNHASVIGNVTWQPGSGQIGGAIQLDGNGSYLEAPHILNPAEGVFSAFAWVNGGAPGQVILSQADGVGWLMLDAQANLKTSLKGGTRLPDLNSGVMLSDDTWHRIGFIWDGESRALYIDDVEVARDPHTAIEEALGGLIVGAGSSLKSGTHWSGLIDDVRIYNRVVEP